MQIDSEQIHANGYDPIVEEFDTYEAYLNSQVSKKDLYYLEDDEVARRLVELGIRGNGETIPREEFDQRKAYVEKIRQEMFSKKPKRLVSKGMDFSDDPLLKVANLNASDSDFEGYCYQALQQREEAVRNGKLATVVFICDFNSTGQQVSGYVSFGQRLESESMGSVFQRKKRLLPKPTDLSYYNWNTQTIVTNSTSEFQIVADDEKGMLLKHKRDRKLLNVDPNASPGDNSTRTEIETDTYLHVVIYDHVVRRRN